MTVKDTILIVDDSPIVAMVRESQAGIAMPTHKTLVVDNLADAKKAIDGGKISAVITDNDFFAKPNDSIPVDNSGIELVRHIRATAPDTPVLWNSGTLDQSRMNMLSEAAHVPAVTVAEGDKRANIAPNIMAIQKSTGDLPIVEDFLKTRLAPIGQDIAQDAPSSGLPRSGGKGGQSR